MKRLFYLLVVLCLRLGKAKAQLQADTGYYKPDWVYVGESAEHQAYYIQSTPISSKYGSIKVWLKGYEHKTIIDGKTYTSTMTKYLFNFDCSEKKMRNTLKVVYSFKNRIIKSYDYQNTEWMEVVPETIGATILNKACELFK